MSRPCLKRRSWPAEAGNRKVSSVTRVGVLALQGAFIEHIAMLRRLGAEAFPVRLRQQLDRVDALIVPGGESTSISRLMADYQLTEPVRELALNGIPIFGTCAGLIIMAKQIQGQSPGPLAVMDIEIKRNAFGRQVDSFETDLSVPVLGKPEFRAIFIRAPRIERTGEGVEVLARLDGGTAVAARQDNLLVTTFHPELTDDPRFHEYFLSLVSKGGRGGSSPRPRRP